MPAPCFTTSYPPTQCDPPLSRSLSVDNYLSSVPHSRLLGSSSVFTFSDSHDSHASLILSCSSSRSRRLHAASVFCSFSLVQVTLNLLYLLILCCLNSASLSFSCNLLTLLVSLVKFRACVVKFVKFHVLLNKNQLIKKQIL